MSVTVRGPESATDLRCGAANPCFGCVRHAALHVTLAVCAHQDAAAVACSTAELAAQLHSPAGTASLCCECECKSKPQIYAGISAFMGTKAGVEGAPLLPTLYISCNLVRLLPCSLLAAAPCTQ